MHAIREALPEWTLPNEVEDLPLEDFLIPQVQYKYNTSICPPGRSSHLRVRVVCLLRTHH